MYDVEVGRFGEDLIANRAVSERDGGAIEHSTRPDPSQMQWMLGLSVAPIAVAVMTAATQSVASMTGSRKVTV